MFAQPPVLWLINWLIDAYIFVLIAQVILSWLISLGIVNRYQPFVQQIGVFLNRLTEPVLMRIRKRLPPMGGIDLSPLVLFISLKFLQYCVNYFWARYLV